ncbi:hypothetical protein [Marinomonas sp. GJ51-6]|uniref:hypothetical protein n=1 Tax=Marinomonas sp. GJ51-6 TaxID=2992802 RepID=UPI0029349055|nr:hypothetical protein [Marinomonas sp. GJ51-6]WOD08839.1 hypothetical protein ONZ50_07230 [Marinomonas sp. GJ51-6]
MKLEYKVLWFEDQFSEIEGDVNRLESFILECGFIPDFDHRGRISEEEIEELALKLDNYNPYDLIIFDYDLGEGSAKGLNIAAHLRSKIYTDMIFYSGQIPQQLRKMLFENEVDGVFIVHRGEFYNEIEPIIDDHIKKMSDLNNIRGVVMSETSAMDLALREILIEKTKTFSEERLQTTFETLKDRLIRKLEENKLKIEGLTSLKSAVSDHFVTGFDQVRVTLKETLGELGETNLKDGSLVHQVQVERNKLAHQKASLSKGGKMLLHGKKESVEYNYDEFKRLRNDLLEAHSDIKKLSS